MANDRIVVAMVAFAVPEHLLPELTRKETLYNVEMLVDCKTYLRAISLNKCDLEIAAIVDAETQELVDISNTVDNVYTPNRLVNRVAELYKNNPEFKYTEINPEDKG